MTSEHDLDLARRIVAGTAVGVLEADDPHAVLARTPGAVRVGVDDLPCAIAAARVRLAEVLLARARRAEPEVDDAPVVRAAEAHLRRQQAAWKVAWWAREERVPDLDSWSPGIGRAASFTLVAVDPTRAVDADAHATMTATAPAAVRVVVLRARA